MEDNELKTLKDMKDKLASHIVEQREFLHEAEFVSVDDLKQEAIKWFKDDIMLQQSARTFIRNFFNLTEEDLK